MTFSGNQQLVETSLLRILDATQHGTLTSGKLEKLFYFAEFDYYEKHETELFGMKYRKSFDLMCFELQQTLLSLSGKNKIRCAADSGGYYAMRWVSNRKTPPEQANSKYEEHIDWEIQRFASYSTADMNNFLFSDIPWMAAVSETFLDPELVFYRDEVHAVTESE